MNKTTVTKTTYTVNGKSYDRLEDVPQPHRDTIAKLLEDKNQDGVPDVFDDGAGNRVETKIVTTHESSTIRDLNTGRNIFEDELVRKFTDTDRKSGITINLSANAILLIIAVLLIVGLAVAAMLYLS